MTSPFHEALREQLRAAAVRDLQRKHRPWRRILGAVTAVMGAATAAVAVLTPSPAAADIEVTIEHGRVEVRIVDLVTSPDEVQEELDEEGLPVTVSGVPVGPSNVGRFVAVQLEVPDGRTIEQLGGDGGGFDGFVIPEGWPGTLLIEVGVPAPPGEPYTSGSDAFAPEEPLHCVDIRGRTVVDAGRLLPDLEVVRVRAATQDAVDLADALEGELAGWYVVGARALAADHVLLEVQASPPPVAPEDPTC